MPLADGWSHQAGGRHLSERAARSQSSDACSGSGLTGRVTTVDSEFSKPYDGAYEENRRLASWPEVAVQYGAFGKAIKAASWAER